jgi:hypothetical protein
MSDRWYYIGENSLFDSDMDTSEMIDNFFNRSQSTDIDAYYYYLMSKISSYWTKFLELKSLKTEEELWNLYNTKDSHRRTMIFKTWENVKNMRFTRNEGLYPKQKKFVENESTYDGIYKFITKNLIHSRDLVKSDNVEKNRRKMTKTFSESFLIMGNLLSGIFTGDPWYFYKIKYATKKDDFGDDFNLGLLANETGWHSYNSYLFSLLKGVYIVGIPSETSTYDGVTGCVNDFIFHDYVHTYTIAGSAKVELDIPRYNKIYEYVMNSDIYDREKERLSYSLFGFFSTK